MWAAAAAAPGPGLLAALPSMLYREVWGRTGGASSLHQDASQGQEGGHMRLNVEAVAQGPGLWLTSTRPFVKRHPHQLHQCLTFDGQQVWDGCAVVQNQASRPSYAPTCCGCAARCRRGPGSLRQWRPLSNLFCDRGQVVNLRVVMGLLL
jgi:hypothetical protein